MCRVKHDRLPTLSNLFKRGISISSVGCPLCESFKESLEHVLASCLMVNLEKNLKSSSGRFNPYRYYAMVKESGRRLHECFKPVGLQSD